MIQKRRFTQIKTQDVDNCNKTRKIESKKQTRKEREEGTEESVTSLTEIKKGKGVRDY